jgi:hypothetical protein
MSTVWLAMPAAPTVEMSASMPLRAVVSDVMEA